MSKQGVLQLQSSNSHTEAKPDVVKERKENPKKVICSPCVTILISKAPIDTIVQSQPCLQPTTYQTLKRDWPSEEEASTPMALDPPSTSRSNATLQRWIGESVREQPWNGVGIFLPTTNLKGKPVVREEGHTNSALAGSEKGSEKGSLNK